MEEIEERKFNRLLRVAFTPEEKVDMVEEAGSAYRDRIKAEADLATVKAQFQGKIKEAEARIGSLFERINSGWEMRNVACREVKDFATGSVVVFRDDTQELIEERAMTLDERQQEFPFEGKVVDAEFNPTTAIEEKGPPGSDLSGEASVSGQPDSSPIPGAPLDLPEDTNPFYVGKKEGKDV